MSVYLTKPVLHLPPEKYAQSDILNFMLSESGLSDMDRRKIQSVYKDSGIDYRNSVFPWFRSGDSKKEFDYSMIETRERMEIYSKEASHIGSELVQKIQNGDHTTQGVDLNSITHVVWVSCTGLTAPGIETTVLKNFSFSKDIQCTAFNFMGCHGFFHALRFGSLVVQNNPNAKVLILCVELCTLHFQKNTSEDQILANSLFADGGAAVLLFGMKPEEPHVKIEKQSQSYFHDSSDQMAWTLGTHGFDMRLSRKLPVSVSNNIHHTIEKLLEVGGVGLNQLKAWIFHPGGKRILDLLQSALHLSEQDLKSSREVLRMNGNVSSASVLFALHHFLENNQNNFSEYGLMLGLGPGLAMETALFVI